MVGLKTFHFELWSHLQTCAVLVGPEPAVYLGSPGPQGLAMGVGGRWTPFCEALPKLGRSERFHPAGKIHRDQVIGVFMHFCQPRADPQDTSPGTLCSQHDHGVQTHSCGCFLGSHYTGSLSADSCSTCLGKPIFPGSTGNHELHVCPGMTHARRCPLILPGQQINKQRDRLHTKPEWQRSVPAPIFTRPAPWLNSTSQTTGTC